MMNTAKPQKVLPLVNWFPLLVLLVESLFAQLWWICTQPVLSAVRLLGIWKPKLPNADLHHKQAIVVGSSKGGEFQCCGSQRHAPVHRPQAYPAASLYSSFDDQSGTT